MGITVHIGLPTKPNKSPVAAIAKASGLQEKDDPGNYIWVFQKKTVRIMLEDMRETVKVDREWCDEVSWIHNWGIVISLSGKRTEVDYQNWIALISLIASSHGASYLHFDEGSGDPTTRWKVSDFLGIQNLHSEDGSNVSPAPRLQAKEEPAIESFDDDDAGEVEEVAPASSASTNLQEMIRAELAKQGLVAPGESAALTPQSLEPVEEEDDDDDDEDFSGYDDWDDF
tara:strand:- start:661 stop:1344 length:684 start_codon:yes stop_codon:yes gene_type:complete